MLNRYPYSLPKIGLTVAICLGTGHWLTDQALAASLSRVAEALTEENSTLIPVDSLSDFVVTEDSILSALSQDEPIITTSPTTQSISEESSLSVESIITSLRQLDFSATIGDSPVPDIPVLSQSSLSDAYQDVYNFGETAAQELSNPISSNLLPSTPTQIPGGGVIRENQTTAVGIPRPNVSSGPSLPTFGGPLPGVGGPQANFVTPLRQTDLPSARRAQAGQWGDSQVDIFFASLPQAEVVDINTFMRTVYRTNPSDMIERIDQSLDLTVDAEFHLMPNDIFPANRLPSDSWQRNL